MRRNVCDGWLTALIGSVWIFHGLYSKLLDGVPRHRMIVERILGEGVGAPATIVVGALEVFLGLWVFTRRRRLACVLLQTLAIVSMNTLEILLAKDLLVSAAGMVALNGVFLSAAWYWALAPRRAAA
jgi:DoxX-like family